MILPLTFCLAWSGCTSDPTPRTSVESSQSQTLEDVIPLTSANLRGHKMLYDEGWYVITSSKKSLEYAKEKSIRSSSSAIQEASLRMAAHSSGYTSTLGAANIDNLGNVHPDTMWWDCTLGNVKSRPFSAIWVDTRHPIMAGLKQRPRQVGGRCGSCAYFDVCGGNTRVRALKVSGDPWAEDPACYLADEEIAA